MRTFMARFVRPDGQRGVLYVLSTSPSAAVLEVMQQQGPVSQITVTPRRRAALLVQRPWPLLPPPLAPGGTGSKE